MTNNKFIIVLIFCVLQISVLFAKNSDGKKVVLVRSSWQTINIGDIAHSPGLMTILEKHMPDVEIRLWATNVGNGVREILQRRFPNMEIMTSKDTATLKRAFAESDFLLHGSGPFFVAYRDVARWKRETNKPYGVYGITLNDPYINPEVISLLTDARFAYFRDSYSCQEAKRRGVKCPIMEFAPDAAFGVDLRNEQAAVDFMQKSGLEAGKFMCVIPRYRYTPAWLVYENRAYDAERAAYNNRFLEHDHLPLREAIIALIRQTDMKVLICAESCEQVQLGKEMLYDKLPDDVKQKVVWRNSFWLTDEAMSIYKHSAGVFGLEMHSPIMCIGNDVPAIVGRFHEQTSKGLMWNDIGLNDWLFDFDNPKDLDKFVPTVLSLVTDKEAALKKTKAAHKRVNQIQNKTMNVLKKELSK